MRAYEIMQSWAAHASVYRADTAINHSRREIEIMASKASPALARQASATMKLDAHGEH